ncbi:DUF6882 domain-containing protein [Chitinilyticum aquatile]|uniref:DUF6882 domain-containing protein n=1 Tax=Chitinilyticum aquatile TaxID=362520 RepID=UPI00040A4DF5|nr:DUF6882 domain-containing protein [Chitinilyticum aquatile]
MGLFSSLFGGESIPATPSFASLFEEHAAMGMLKQQAFARHIGEGDRWNADLDAGTLSFDNGYTVPVQLLGTESLLSQTWLWSWANTQLGLPDESMSDALALRQLGEDQNIAELAQGQVDVDEHVDGYRLALIACGVLERGGFYRGGYDNGAAYLLVQDAPPLDAQDEGAMQLIGAINRVISEYEINHRAMLQHFFRQLGYPAVPDRDDYTITLRSGEPLTIRFNERDLIAGLDSQLRVAAF